MNRVGILLACFLWISVFGDRKSGKTLDHRCVQLFKRHLKVIIFREF